MTGEYWGFIVKNQVSHQVSQSAKMRPLGSLRPLTCEKYGETYQEAQEAQVSQESQQEKIGTLGRGGTGESK